MTLEGEEHCDSTTGSYQGQTFYSVCALRWYLRLPYRHLLSDCSDLTGTGAVAQSSVQASQQLVGHLADGKCPTNFQKSKLKHSVH